MSIRQIAELAGTSTATVSRILNNPDYKSTDPHLRERVVKAAMELNYVPNEAARNLKKGKNRISKIYRISILVTRMDGADVDPFFRELLQAVESEIHNNTCILNRVWYHSLFFDEKSRQSVDYRKLVKELKQDAGNENDGLIIIGKCTANALEVMRGQFPHIVSVNRNAIGDGVDEVLCDGKKIASLAVEYLAGLGHKKIAYAGKCHGEARYQGYQEVMRRYRLDFFPEYVADTRQTEKAGFHTMESFIKLKEPPTAVYCANDIIAVGMLKCLSQYRNLPYMPSVISSDDIEAAQLTKPMLSTVSIPKADMAKFALYLLLDRMKGGHTGSVRIELEGKLLIRNSCTSVDEVQQDYCI